MNILNKAQLQHVIEECLYSHHFQPIIDIHKMNTLGYESFLRSKYIDNPESLFYSAINSNRLLELDMSSVRMAIHSFGNQIDRIATDIHIFVNIYPSTLASPLFINTFMNRIESSLISPNQIILEINESEQITNYSTLIDSINKLKEVGIQIALDDFDKGTSALKKILELEPNYVKFDKYFSKNLTQSTKKQKMLKSILNYCSSNNIQTILEGIEADNDLYVARSLGVDFGQGYLLGKPDTLNSFL